MANSLYSTLTAEPGLVRYLDAIRKFPMLNAEEERALARRCRDPGDADAARRLVTSHLRLVAKIAMAYRGYGLPIGEIMSEGSVGLMRAVRRFDAERGYRLATYAIHWIRAAIQDYILRSWSLVKMATSANRRKLFYNLRRTKARISALDDDLQPGQAAQIASRLQVAEKDVIEMNMRLNGDVSLNVPLTAGAGERMDLLVDGRERAEATLIAGQEESNRIAALHEALSTLKPRERRIFEARRLSDSPMTLEQLSTEFGVSRERVRQIEQRVFGKVRAAVKKSLAERETPRAIADGEALRAAAPPHACASVPGSSDAGQIQFHCVRRLGATTKRRQRRARVFTAIRTSERRAAGIASTTCPESARQKIETAR